LARVLAVSDQVDEGLYGDLLGELAPDLIVSCGDLPFDYLEYLVTRANKPLVFVPGNHDQDLTPRPTNWAPLSFDDEIPGPQGCDNADGRFVEAAGLTIAGLGGSIRYRDGPNQYTQGEMRRRALGLELRARLGRRRVDVFLAHSPPLRSGDGEDAAHRGFGAFRRVIQKLQPRLFVHGHLHPYGRKHEDRVLGPTRVVNAVPYRLLEVNRSS
jgi:Icc-related predicted phosphoesterase